MSKYLIAALSASLVMFAAPAQASKCVGADPCHACHTCEYCKRCAVMGLKCGVCKKAKGRHAHAKGELATAAGMK